MANSASSDQKLALYHYRACGYCARVRYVIEQLGLDLELRDIRRSREHFTALVSGGGKSQVPALRIQSNDESTTWLYESRAIIQFLHDEYEPTMNEG